MEKSSQLTAPTAITLYKVRKNRRFVVPERPRDDRSWPKGSRKAHLKPHVNNTQTLPTSAARTGPTTTAASSRRTSEPMLPYRSAHETIERLNTSPQP